MASDVLDSLTAKQAEALEMVLRRMSSKEIARELGITPWSVDKRLDAARVKLGAHSREEAARIYVRERYGESFAGEPFAVALAGESRDASPRTAPRGGDGNGGSQPPDPSERVSPPYPSRRGVSWFDPAGLRPAGRLGLIVAGALAISLLLLSGVGIANGLQTLLTQ